MLTSQSRVLIADGDPELRRRMFKCLLELDVFSDCVSDGQATLAYLRERPYAMVILDLTIGKTDAVTIVDAIGTLPRESRPMVLATTGSDGRPSLDSDLVQIVLRKPFALEEVAAIIRSCIVSVREARQRSGPDSLELRPSS